MDRQTKMYSFAQVTCSTARDVIHRFQSNGAVVDVGRAVDIVQRMRKYECPIGFRFWKRLHMTPAESYEGLAAHTGVPAAILRDHVEILGVFRRDYPPEATVALHEVQKWYTTERYTDCFGGGLAAPGMPVLPATFTPHEDVTRVFFDPIVTCLVIAEMVRLSSCSLVVPVELATPSVPCGAVLDVVSAELCVHNAYRVEHRIRTPVFQEGDGKLTIPFPVKHKAGDATFTTKSTVLRVMVKMPDGSLASVLVNPWDGVTHFPRFAWADPDPSGMDVIPADSAEVLKYAKVVEDDIRACWGVVLNPVSYPAAPSMWDALAEMSSSVVFMGTMHDFASMFATQGLPHVSRELCMDLVRFTLQHHVAHMVARGSMAGMSHAAGTVSVTYGPCGDYAVVYTTALVKVGVRYRLVHVAMIANNDERLHDFFRAHWDPATQWVDESFFLIAATRASRMSPLYLIPIPMDRVFYRDPHLCGMLAKPTSWRLAGCNCVMCSRRRRARVYLKET